MLDKLEELLSMCPRTVTVYAPNGTIEHFISFYSTMKISNPTKKLAKRRVNLFKKVQDLTEQDILDSLGYEPEVRSPRLQAT